MTWPAHPLVYEINTRVWLRELQLAAGRRLGLHEIPDQVLDGYAARGFDALWLMGVWTSSPGALAVALTDPGQRRDYERALPDLTPDDVVASPYAIARYEVPGWMGGPAGLAALRERLSSRGLRLLLDFVPNHLACDHAATISTPAAFVRGTDEDLDRDPRTFFQTAAGHVLAHGRDPFFPAWADTVQVDVSGAAGRALLQQELAVVAAQCDGVRCDMAMLLLPDVFARTWGSRPWSGLLAPRSFWAEAIRQVRSEQPDFLFVAECYWELEHRLLEDGFDFTYDKILYDRLHQGDAAGVRAHLAGDPAFQARCLRFVENHDEPRVAAVFSRERARSAAVVSLCAPGLRLVHEGQEDGWRVKLPVQLGRRPQEGTDPDTRAFYDRLFAFLGRPELKEGRWRLLDVEPPRPGEDVHRGLIAYRWEGDSATAGSLVVVNLADTRRWGRIAVEGVGAGSWLLYDHADDQAYERDGEEMYAPGLFVALDPHQTHLFELRPSRAQGTSP
jgi:hypothetical protein